MKSFKMAIIIGFAAICAIIATVIIITSGSGDYGLYITDLSGNTDITTAGKGSASAVNGVKLNKGDVITVSPESTCQITYKSKKNKDKNYIVLEPDTQVIVSDEFNGNNSGDLFLMQGSVICNSAADIKANINIRTVTAQFNTAKTVSVIKLVKSDENENCDFYSFMGTLIIQRYDLLGSSFEKPENLVEKKCGEIIIKDDKPAFEFLNIDFSLSDLPKHSLKELLIISQLINNFTYSSDELKDAYAKANDTSESVSQNNTDESSFVETTTPLETEPTVSHTWEITTAPVYVPQTTYTTQETNKQTESQASSDSKRVFTVTIIIDGDSEIQEVEYGKNAEQPADPVIDGLIFIGWDNSFENITHDTVITALFISDESTTIVTPGTTAIEYGEYTVTFIIDGSSYSQQVAYGQAAQPPYIPYTNSNGNIFVGWDKSFDYITSNLTVTAVFS
jgi:hypothetical protein